MVANSPDLYLDALPLGPQPQVWLDVGAHDREVMPAIRHMHDLLAGRGYPVQMHVRPGVHTFIVWRPALRESLAWFAGDVARVSAA
jgi:enterochelin esterase-like enzyme